MRLYRSLAARFLEDEQGVAAIEFMFVAPALLILYLGMSEISIAVTADKKLQDTTAMVSDLIGRETEIDKATIKAVFGISSSTLYPYEANDLEIQTFGIRNEAAGKFKIEWAVSSTGDKPQAPSANLAALQKLDGNYFILTKATMRFVPISGVSALEYNLEGEAVSRVRRVDSLPCKDC